MSESATQTAMIALTEWWEDMGVDVDEAEIAALTKARPQRQSPQTATGQTSAGSPKGSSQKLVPVQLSLIHI